MKAPTTPEVFEAGIDAVLLPDSRRNPWASPADYRPDYDLLRRLLSIPVGLGATQESGLFAKASDAWAAHELRSAGFGEHEVWPRRLRPRVLAQSLAPMEAAIKDLAAKGRVPPSLRSALKGSATAKVLGQYYPKQVDVLIANWDRGSELMISTKSMLSSYNKNLRNRFEEFVGDAKNLRGRYPLAAIGLLFIARTTVHDESGAFEFLVDMLRRLRAPDSYDAAGLVIAEWDEERAGSWRIGTDFTDSDALNVRLAEPPFVSIQVDRIPEDVGPGVFLAQLIDAVLSRTPVSYHVEARACRLGRRVPVEEEAQAEDADPQAPT